MTNAGSAAILGTTKLVSGLFPRSFVIHRDAGQYSAQAHQSGYPSPLCPGLEMKAASIAGSRMNTGGDGGT